MERIQTVVDSLLLPVAMKGSFDETGLPGLDPRVHLEPSELDQILECKAPPLRVRVAHSEDVVAHKVPPYLNGLL